MQQPRQGTEADFNDPGEGLAQVMLAAFSRAWTSVAASGGVAHGPVPPQVGKEVGKIVGQILEGLFLAGQRHWPDLAVDGGKLAAHLAGQVPPDSADLPAALGAVNGADLYLAVACATGVPGALEAFDRACAAAINGTIAGIDRAPSFRTDVRQALHERLFVGSTDAPARIWTYAGRGPLAAWVAIVTQRLALLMRRTEQNRARIEDRAAGEPMSPPDDPELAYLKQRYREEFKAAYRTALEALPERDRTLLRLHLFEGVTLDRLGAMFGVNASTVSRWIEKARAAIRDVTQARLHEQLRVSTGEFASLARLVVSQLDVSIMALFEPPRPHQP